MKRVIFYAAILITLLSSVSCVTVSVERYLKTEPNLPRVVHLENVPYIRQTAHHCGPASLAMILNWAGKKTTAQALSKEMFTPKASGTFQEDVLGAIRREGFLAIPVKSFDSLFHELAAGNPVLVFEDLTIKLFPIWHYAVVTGYDLNRGKIYLHSGSDPDLEKSLGGFDGDWSGGDYWGVVVLPPGQLSASGDEWMHLKAAAGLERIGLLDKALLAYQAILTRWPHSLGALIGIGNVQYAQGHYEESARALAQATVFHSKVSAAWHNLAVAYAAENKERVAKYAAERALDLAPEDDLPTYRRSLASLLR